MALAPITTNGPTITVSNEAELDSAYAQLSGTAGGGTILLEPGFYGSMGMDKRGTTEEPVVIKSADPDNPAEFYSFSFRGVENLRIENILVDSTTPPSGSEEKMSIWVKDSANIQFVDSTFLHDVDNVVKETGEGVLSLSHFRDSDDILFENNLVNGYFHAIQATEIDGLEVVNNELTNMQGDGFRGGGLQNLVIEGNYFHDFFGSDQNLTHSDLIQLWGTNAYTLTQNVTISGNILMTSSAASQSIFIRNEEFGNEGDSTAGHFTNITITDNLIYNAHRWGIHLDNVDGALVDGNTLLWNPEAVMEVNGQAHSWWPEIFSRNSLDVTVTNNITPFVRTPDGSIVTDEGNVVVDFSNPLLPNYVDKHFANPLAGTDVTVEDLYLLPSSPWYNVAGSSLGVYLQDISDGVLPVISPEWSEDDRYEVTFNADSSLDQNGPTIDNPNYTYHWSFSDGTTAEGVSVTKVYDSGGHKGVELEIRLDGDVVASAARNYGVITKDIYASDFENGTMNLSDGVAEVIDAGSIVGSDDGKGYLIGDGQKLELGRDTMGIYEMETFGIALDLTPTGDEPSGTFLELYKTMRGWTNDDGYFGFELTTDSGTYSLVSRDPVFDDGDTHRIGIAFNGKTGQLELFADGESVSSTEAWGTTPPETYYSLLFGQTFKDSMDAIIDNVVVNIDPAVAGQLAEITPPVQEEEPPVQEEEPPVQEEEPPVQEDEPPVSGQDPSSDGDTGGRGTPQDPVRAEGDENFLDRILNLFLRIFGLDDDDDDQTTALTSASLNDDVTLNEIIPETAAQDDAEDGLNETEDDIMDLAA